MKKAMGDLCRRGVLVFAIGTLVEIGTSLAATRGGPTEAEAREFVAETEARLLELVIELARASWVQVNFMTEDTDILAVAANERFVGEAMSRAKASTRFEVLELDFETARKLEILKRGLTLPAPDEESERLELSTLAAGMKKAYGRGEYCSASGECRDLSSLSQTMSSSRDPQKLLEAWLGWRTASPPMRDDYARFVELANKGARELGFANLGAMWRSGYDMDPNEFRAELDRLWSDVRPLYESLHCYVRQKLNAYYGDQVVPAKGALPAHVLGSMWAQKWSSIYDLVAPEQGGPGFDLTELLQSKGLDAREMVEYGERFFTSLGFEPLPDTFWERSLFTKPEDRDVVCHASAWDIDQMDDLRIKMCIQISGEDFSTIHHELGHNFYQRAYSSQPFLFRESAHDGFHEGVGDTIALSVTPDYLVEIGLLDQAPDPTGDLGVLLKTALDKIAFVPFGLVVDEWRWKVFSGELDPGEYNAGWWELRERYQGVRAPVERGEDSFDPGAKYHVPANYPYAGYFLAHILQFQVHRALCGAADDAGPLHQCSIYGHREAGERLIRALEMGASRPWQDALETLTGQREMDPSAMLEYFSPLEVWLAKQTEGLQCGW